MDTAPRTCPSAKNTFCVEGADLRPKKPLDPAVVFVRMDNKVFPDHYVVSEVPQSLIKDIKAKKAKPIPEVVMMFFNTDHANAVATKRTPPDTATWLAHEAIQGRRSDILDILHRGWETVAEKRAAVELQDLPMASWNEAEQNLRREPTQPLSVTWSFFKPNMSKQQKSAMAGNIMRALRAIRMAEEKHGIVHVYDTPPTPDREP